MQLAKSSGKIQLLFNSNLKNERVFIAGLLTATIRLTADMTHREGNLSGLALDGGHA